MANPFESFWLFAYLVASHAITLLAGCIVTVMLGLTEKYILKRSLPPKWEIVILGVFLFYACFQTWRDEHRALVLLQGNFAHPVFSGEVNAIAIARHRIGAYTIPVMFASMIVTNPHGPPSGLVNLKMGIKNPVSGITWGNALPLSMTDQSGSAGHDMPPLTFRNNKYLPNETLDPIPAGASVVGWFWSRFTQDELNEAAKNRYYVIIQFTDAASGTEHTMETQLPGPGIHWGGILPNVTH